MSADDVFSFEMSDLHASHDRDVDRILSGRAPLEEGHEDLRALVEGLRAAYPEEAVPTSVEQAHLAIMMQAARLTTEEGEPVVRPARKAAGPTARPDTRRRPMREQLLTSLVVKIAAAAIAGLTLFGGAAAAGALPDPAQSAMANVAAHIGFQLPTGAPEAPKVPDSMTLPEQAKVPTSVPVGHAPGAPGVPDHVQLPDQAKGPRRSPSPTDLPVRRGRRSYPAARSGQGAHVGPRRQRTCRCATGARSYAAARSGQGANHRPGQVRYRCQRTDAEVGSSGRSSAAAGAKPRADSGARAHSLSRGLSRVHRVTQSPAFDAKVGLCCGGSRQRSVLTAAEVSLTRRMAESTTQLRAIPFCADLGIANISEACYCKNGSTNRASAHQCVSPRRRARYPIRPDGRMGAV